MNIVDMARASGAVVSEAAFATHTARDTSGSFS